MKILSVLIPSKSEFNNTVQKILSRAEYKHLKNSIGDFVQRVKEAVREWLQKFFSKTFSSMEDSSKVSDNLSTIFMIVGLLIILAIIILIVVRMNKTFEKKGKIKEILGEKIDDRTTPRTLREKALTFEKEGDFRQAIRFDFIALLLLMHERTILYLDETKTNGEIYQFLKKSNFSRIKIFEELINNFNSSWYGHKSFSKEEYKAFEDRFNLIWNEVINYEEKGK